MVFTVCIYAISLLIVAAVAVTIIPLIKVGAAFSGHCSSVALVALDRLDSIDRVGYWTDPWHTYGDDNRSLDSVALCSPPVEQLCSIFPAPRWISSKVRRLLQKRRLREKKWGSRGTIFQQLNKAWAPASQPLSKKIRLSSIGKGWGPYDHILPTTRLKKNVVIPRCWS